VVRGRDDREECDHGVGEGDPPPAVAHHDDEPDGDHHRPAEVQRRHRRELVGDRLGVVGGVDVGSVHVEGVDEAGHHPRRGERVGHVDRECGCRDTDQPVPHRAVPVGPADEQPQHEGDGDREVDADVVAVEECDQRLAAEGEVLNGALGHEPAALDAEHVGGVGHRLVGVVAGEEADLAVADEQRRHQGDLTHERPAGERGDPRRERSVFGPDRVLSQYLTHVDQSKCVWLANH
jgi:hypothetical protein